MESEGPTKEPGSGVFRVVVDAAPAGGGVLPPNEADQFLPQAGPLRALFHRETKELDFDQVKTELGQHLAQVSALADVADHSNAAAAGFRLSEIELGLTITAEGHLAFIASAGVSATLTVRFNR